MNLMKTFRFKSMHTKNDGKKFGLLVLLSLSLLGEPMELLAGKVEGRQRSTIVDCSVCKRKVYLEHFKEKK